ncbi:MAG: nucleotidyl transferase AbiEii/AbiGii toxin family protein [Acidobacteriota bacterium]
MSELQWNPEGSEIEPRYAQNLPSLVERLGRFAEREWAQDDFYLAGGAALALYLGHREPRSLDFMSAGNRLVPQQRRDLLQDILALDPEARVETARDGYLFLRSGDGAALRWFYYPYPQVDPEHEVAAVPLASAVDLGLMKLGALISRGLRRDFYDLFLLVEHLPLETLLTRAEDKFGHVRDFPLQTLKGLADRSLTEGESDPRLDGPLFHTERQPPTWKEVEDFFDSQVRELGRRQIGWDEP